MLNFVFIVAYFALMLFLGFYFRKRNRSTDDFFYGKGKMPWLWVGASAFVSQFSASSFTIVAGRAYTDGLSVLIVYWANALSFIIAALYCAPKLRQLKVANPVEVVRMRFGPKNEKLFSLLSIPSYLIFPALWLNGLAVFVSGAFAVNTKIVILVIGLVTLCMSAFGGSWTIISSDFVQCVMIFVLGVFAAMAALVKMGGWESFSSHVPPNSIVPNEMQLIVFVLWITYMTMQKSMNTNSLFNTLRFNSVESSLAARKAAWTAAFIYIFGSFIWFVPAWASSILIPNIKELFPTLERPQMAAYLAFVKYYMPAGVLGLSVAVLFAATMSSIDSSLNWCSGFLTRCFYKNHPSGVTIARAYTLIFGALVIAMGLFYENLKIHSLFDLTYRLITYVHVPILIPMLLALWIKKTPDWSFPLTIVIGFSLSLFLSIGKDTVFAVIIRIFEAIGIERYSTRDVSITATVGGLFAHIIVDGGFFVSSRFFFRGYTTIRRKNVTDFYTRLSTPIPSPRVREPWIRRSKTTVYAIAITTCAIIVEFFLFSHFSPVVFYCVALPSAIVAVIYTTKKNRQQKTAIL